MNRSGYLPRSAGLVLRAMFSNLRPLAISYELSRNCFREALSFCADHGRFSIANPGLTIDNPADGYEPHARPVSGNVGPAPYSSRRRSGLDARCFRRDAL